MKTLVGTPDPSDLPDPEDFLDDIVRDLAPESREHEIDAARNRLAQSAKASGSGDNEPDIASLTEAIRALTAAIVKASKSFESVQHSLEKLSHDLPDR